MLFTHPQALWLLLVVPVLAAAQLMMRRQGSWLRQVLVILVRSLALEAVIGALARPVIEQPAAGETVVAVVDVSASMSREAIEKMESEVRKLVDAAGPDQAIQVVAFAGRPMILPNTRPWPVGALETAQKELGDRPRGEEPTSGLADALDLAGTLIQRDGQGRIVLWTDGLQTHGDAAGAAARLARRGIPVAPTAVEPSVPGPILIKKVEMVAAAGVGATVPVRITIESREVGEAQVEIRDAVGAVRLTKKVAVVRGVQVVEGELAVNRRGLIETTVTAAFTAPGARGDTWTAAICGEAPLSVAVVEPYADQRGAKALTKLLGLAGAVRNIAAGDLNAAGALANVDVLVLADIPAASLSVDAQKNIRSAQGEGMGLLFSGGPQSFGPGGYADSALVDLMPVTMPQQIEDRDPSTTLVAIIDTSGSMQGPRIALAKEVVRLAMRRLGQHDKMGIVEFYGSKRWAAPIQPASNSLDLNRALNRLTAGGGTVILPAIEEAYFALKNVNTQTRHVIIITDGGVESGPFEPLIRRMSDEGITVSTVLAGPGLHSEFLASLSQWGRGRFYAAPDRFALPEIILRQPQTQVIPPMVEEPSRITAVQPNNLTKGIDFTLAPPMTGYVRTNARTSADVVLRSERGDPVLVRWRYGRGYVAAFTSQFGADWTADWARWPDASVMTSHLSRSLAPRPAGDTLRIEPVARAPGLELRVEAIAGTPADRSAALDIAILDSHGGVVRKETVEPARSGRWDALVGGLAAASYEVRAGSADGHLSGIAGACVPAEREFSSFEADHELLGTIGGFTPEAKRRAAELALVPGVLYREIWPMLTLAGLGLFLGQILVRRWPGAVGRKPNQAAVGEERLTYAP